MGCERMNRLSIDNRAAWGLLVLDAALTLAVIRLASRLRARRSATP